MKVLAAASVLAAMTFGLGAQAFAEGETVFTIVGRRNKIHIQYSPNNAATFEDRTVVGSNQVVHLCVPANFALEVVATGNRMHFSVDPRLRERVIWGEMTGGELTTEYTAQADCGVE